MSMGGGMGLERDDGGFLSACLLGGGWDGSAVAGLSNSVIRQYLPVDCLVQTKRLSSRYILRHATV